MRNALVVVLVAGCWTSSTKPPPPPIANRPAPTPVAAKPEPAPPPPTASVVAAAPPAGTGGTTYGGVVVAQGGAFASLTGTGDISSGLDDANVYGGLVGGDVVRPLEPKIMRGSLDKSTIRNTVKRNVVKVADCYNEQLFAKPLLSGKMTVKITIAGNGKVTNVDASGIDRDVEQCVETALATISFPKAKDGKPTVVAYPFDLHAGEMNGGFGFGRSGFGPGGGGTGIGTIGTGRYGTIGHGSGSGSGYGVGSGRGKSVVPLVSIGQPNVSDTNLDKAIIRRYVKRNIQKLQYCYEKELLNNDKLAGTVTVRFTIEPDGTVTAASASGMGNTTVEDCIAKTLSAIQFPNPKDNKALDVSYPFTFRPAD